MIVSAVSQNLSCCWGHRVVDREKLSILISKREKYINGLIVFSSSDHM